jgi:hypothetical protein
MRSWGSLCERRLEEEGVTGCRRNLTMAGVVNDCKGVFVETGEEVVNGRAGGILRAGVLPP